MPTRDHADSNPQKELRTDASGAKSETVLLESRRLDGALANKARWKIRRRLLFISIFYTLIIAFAAQHQNLLEQLILEIGELWALAALIGAIAIPLIWAEVRKITIQQKWDNTSPRLNATMRLDCAKSYTRALRLYVNLNQVYRWVMLWAAAYIYIAIVQFNSSSFTSIAIGETGAALCILAAALFVLWRGYVFGHGVFHPGASMVKSILWLHIQAHDPDTSASEKAEMLIEDQIKIRRDHPVWYLNYEISGPRQA